jgi:5-methylcytosine-specific restriction enzyme B
VHEIRDLRVEPTLNKSNMQFWVEKTYVTGRPDRKEGKFAFSQVLWSPQTGKDGRDTYRLMREVRPGDLVFHFVDLKAIVGVSLVAEERDDTALIPEGTQWPAGKPAFVIRLHSFTPLVPPIDRSEYLDAPAYRARLEEIVSDNDSLFYSSKLEPNQGAYLTIAPIALIKIWDEIYSQKTDNHLPLIDPSIFSTLPETALQRVPRDVSAMESAGGTQEKAREYLEAFKKEANEWFAKVIFVRDYFEFFRKFFVRENLERAQWADFQKIGNHLHCFQSMALAKGNALGNPNHSIEHYRKSFIYLAHGPGEPAERIRRFCDDVEYRLDYFGKSAVSELVGYLFPEQFMFVNARDQFAARLLGITVERPTGGGLVDELKAFSDATRPVARQYEEVVGRHTDLPLNLEVDQFFSWLYQNKPDQTTKALTSRPKYWTFSPGEEAEHWKEFYQEGLMAIGWDQMQDLRQFKSKDEIRQKLKELGPTSSNKKNDAKACWQFVHDIEIGDIIFAKQGSSSLLGYGVVEGQYDFHETRTNYKHLRKVKWLAKGDWKMPNHAKMALKTLTDITLSEELVKHIAVRVGLNLGPQGAKTATSVSSGDICYWWLNANPKIWDFRSASVGSVQTYTSHNEAGNKRQKFKYFSAVKPCDLVIGYITKPDKEIIAICEITKALHGPPGQEEIEFRKIEHFAEPVTWAELQSVPALAQCEPIVSNQGSLFAITAEEYEIIRALIDERNLESGFSQPASFTKDDALAGLFISSSELDVILGRLKRKKSLILQGPPGVGKTFIARRLAFALMGERDERRVKMVQFHPSYGYEDFVQGYRPSRGGLIRRDGLFYEFARLARNDPKRDWFFIIDEINRGNLTKIFGELLMLIEADRRGPEYPIPLTYSEGLEETFYLPDNLHIIGTMNTADRSLAMVDYALRRRFGFATLNPALDSPGFASWLSERKASDALISRIRSRVGSLNEVIAKERDLGPGFCIGHSFFCPSDGFTPNEAWYREVIAGEIQPLLEEYFDSSDRVKELVGDLLS